jgi:hypothetical protein
MSSIDITTISTVASTVAVVMGGFLWIVSRAFNLGKTSQRLDTIEGDLSALKTDMPHQIQAVRTELSQEIKALGLRLDQRIDKLALVISESNKR